MTRDADDMSPARFWDDRYGEEGFSFGDQPNAWLAAQHAILLPRMRALVPGDGEGRNGVFLAQCGLAVTTVDASPIGVSKALRLAADRGVSLDAQVADLTTWTWPERAFDLVVSIYLHWPRALRASMHARMAAALKSGGLLLLEGYTPRQLVHRAAGSVGGPRDADMLFETADLADDFNDLDIITLEEVEVMLAEGRRHSGRSSVARLIARRS